MPGAEGQDGVMRQRMTNRYVREPVRLQFTYDLAEGQANRMNRVMVVIAAAIAQLKTE